MFSVVSKLRKKVIKEKNGLLQQSALAFTIRALGAVSGVILNLIITHTLTPKEAGFYFLAFAVTQVLGTIGQLGLPNSILRFIGCGKAEKNWPLSSAAYKTSIMWTFLAACSLAILLYIFTPSLAIYILKKPEAIVVIQAMTPAVLFYALLIINGHALQAVGDVIKSVSTFYIIAQLLLAAFLMSGIIDDAKTAAIFYALACSLTSVISLFWWLKKPNIKWRGIEHFDKTKLWQSCYPLWWVALMGLSVQWAGQLVSSAFVLPEDLATLAVAQRLALLTSFILMAVNLVVAPKFAALYAQGKREDLESIALKATKLMVLFALPITSFIMLFPEWLMWLFGEQYKNGSNLLRILAAGQFICVMSGSVNYLLSMSGHERDLRNVVFFSGPLAIILSLVLVPSYGVTGAAFSTSIALASQNLLAVGMVKRRLGFNTLAIWRRTR